MAITVSKKKPKDAVWLIELTKLAGEAMWNSYSSQQAVALRNMLKRHKGFGNISRWKIQTGTQDYDELGLPYGNNDRIIGIKFWKYKKEWSFP